MKNDIGKTITMVQFPIRGIDVKVSYTILSKKAYLINLDCLGLSFLIDGNPENFSVEIPKA